MSTTRKPYTKFGGTSNKEISKIRGKFSSAAKKRVLAGLPLPEGYENIDEKTETDPGKQTYISTYNFWVQKPKEELDRIQGEYVGGAFMTNLIKKNRNDPNEFSHAKCEMLFNKQLEKHADKSESFREGMRKTYERRIQAIASNVNKQDHKRKRNDEDIDSNEKSNHDSADAPSHIKRQRLDLTFNMDSNVNTNETPHATPEDLAFVATPLEFINSTPTASLPLFPSLPQPMFPQGMQFFMPHYNFAHTVINPIYPHSNSLALQQSLAYQQYLNDEFARQLAQTSYISPLNRMN